MATSLEEQVLDDCFDAFIIKLHQSELFKQRFVEEMNSSMGKCQTAEHTFNIQLNSSFIPANDVSKDMDYLEILQQQVDKELEDEILSDLNFNGLLKDIDTLVFDEELFETIEPMDEDSDVQIIGEFKKTEENESIDAEKKRIVNAVAEDMRQNNNLFSYSKIQKLNNKFRSAMVQFTLFHANYLVCFGCFDGVLLKRTDGLSCPGCNTDFDSKMDISTIKENLKLAVISHSVECKEIFVKFGFHPNGFYYVMCPLNNCSFYQTINL